MAAKRKGARPKQPRRGPQPAPSETKFSSEHYRELGADQTEDREREFGARGFPAHGPSLGEEEEATPAVPEPIPSERREIP